MNCGPLATSIGCGIFVSRINLAENVSRSTPIRVPPPNDVGKMSVDSCYSVEIYLTAYTSGISPHAMSRRWAVSRLLVTRSGARVLAKGSSMRQTPLPKHRPLFHGIRVELSKEKMWTSEYHIPIIR